MPSDLIPGLIVFGLLISLTLVVGSICGIVAVGQLNRLRKEIVKLGHRLDLLKSGTGRPERAPGAPGPADGGHGKAPAPEAREQESEKEEAKGQKPTILAPAPPSGEAPGVPRAAPSALESALADLAKADREWWRNVEQSVGKQWIAWAGALALFVAVGLFVKLAIDSDWIGETGRVVLGVVFGLALLVAGDRFVRKKCRALGQALIGGGLAVLYVSLFAASSYYEIIPRNAGFGLMVLVTATGMTLAVMHDAITISFLAVLGGLLSPVLVSTGEDARDALFAYLVLLDLGVLGTALFRRWRALDVLAFVGTWLLFTGWYVGFHDAVTWSLVPTLLWLGAFYLVFLALPFAYHLRHGTEVTVERLIGALGNATIAFGYAYGLLHGDHSYVLGFIALGMAGSYLALGTLARRRIPTDARALFGFIALAVGFLTLAVPLHLRMHGVTLAWAMEGPVLLYLGYRYRYFAARAFGLVVLTFAVVHLFARHWPLHERLFVPVFNVRFASAMFVPLAGAAYAVIHHWKRKGSEVADRGFKIACALASGFLALAVVHAETYLWCRFRGFAYAESCVVTFVWVTGSVAFLAAGIRARCLASRVSGLVALLVAGILAARIFAHDVPGGYLLLLNARFVAALSVVLVVFAYAHVIRRFKETCPGDEQGLGGFLTGTGVFLLFLLLSVETYAFFREAIHPWQKARWVTLMALSIVWGVYAAALLVVGFWRRNRPLRLVGLALFGLTALKLVLVDMASVKQIYRIVSFLVLGVLMIGASYLYHRVERWLDESSREEDG